MFVAVGFVYLLAVSHRIPARRGVEDLATEFRMSRYLADIVLTDEAASVGEVLERCSLVRDLDVDVLEVYRDGQPYPGVDRRLVLQAGDVLRVRAGVDDIARLLRRRGVRMGPASNWHDRELETRRDALIEAVIAPETPLVGRTVGEVDFATRYGASVLAVRQHGELQRRSLGGLRLQGGSSLLLLIDRDRLATLADTDDFVDVSTVSVPHLRRDKLPVAVATIVGVVLAAALGIVPIVVSALVGCGVLVLTGCLTMDEAYEAVNWQVIFLLGGILSLGVALDVTGAAELAADALVGWLRPVGPVAVVAAFLVGTSLLTSVISNNATAALLAPVALSAGRSLGADPRGFVVAVTFGASLSFMTPVGYQTNTLVYGPGQYRFADFVRIGTPLNLLLWVVGTVLIPVVWPP